MHQFWILWLHGQLYQLNSRLECRVNNNFFFQILMCRLYPNSVWLLLYLPLFFFVLNLFIFEPFGFTLFWLKAFSAFDYCCFVCYNEQIDWMLLSFCWTILFCPYHLNCFHAQWTEHIQFNSFTISIRWCGCLVQLTRNLFLSTF